MNGVMSTAVIARCMTLCTEVTMSREARMFHFQSVEESRLLELPSPSSATYLCPDVSHSFVLALTGHRCV